MKIGHTAILCALALGSAPVIAQDDDGLTPPTAVPGRTFTRVATPPPREEGRSTAERPRSGDYRYASRLARVFRGTPTTTRRFYPKQPVPDTTLNGKTLPFAAREARVRFGDDLTVRRLRFPTAQVAKDWAGAQAAGHLVPIKGRAPQLISVRGSDAVILEGKSLTDAKRAKAMLDAAWRYDPAKTTATDLLSYDDGTAQVLQSGPNRVLQDQAGDIFGLIASVLPERGATPIGHGTAERLGPDGIRSTAADGAIQILRSSKGGVQIENGKAQALARAQAVYDAVAPTARARRKATPTATTVKAGARQALERAGSE